MKTIKSTAGMVQGRTYPTHNIYVHRTPTGWIADMRWTPDAREIVEVMGTAWIPTPFTPQASFETVAQAIAAKNPGASVAEGMTLNADESGRLL
jgi:hypothetical protein